MHLQLRHWAGWVIAGICVAYTLIYPIANQAITHEKRITAIENFLTQQIELSKKAQKDAQTTK